MIFPASSKTFLSKSGCIGIGDMAIMQLGATALTHSKVPAIESLTVLHTQCKCQHSENGK